MYHADVIASRFTRRVDNNSAHPRPSNIRGNEMQTHYTYIWKNTIVADYW